MQVHAALSRNHIPPCAYDRQIALRLRLRTDADFLAKDVWVAVMARAGGIERRRVSLPCGYRGRRRRPSESGLGRGTLGPGQCPARVCGSLCADDTDGTQPELPMQILAAIVCFDGPELPISWIRAKRP